MTNSLGYILLLILTKIYYVIDINSASGLFTIYHLSLLISFFHLTSNIIYKFMYSLRSIFVPEIALIRMIFEGCVTFVHSQLFISHVFSQLLISHVFSQLLISHVFSQLLISNVFS
jgi:hypothetical protein